MSSFARKARRKNLKTFKRDVDYSVDVGTKAKAAVRHATTKQIIRDHGVVSEAYDNLMVLFDVAVHRAFGWGAKTRKRLHAKMARHLLCLKGRMVTTPDIEKILRDEAGQISTSATSKPSHGTMTGNCNTGDRRYECNISSVDYGRVRL